MTVTHHSHSQSLLQVYSQVVSIQDRHLLRQSERQTKHSSYSEHSCIHSHLLNQVLREVSMHIDGISTQATP